MDAVTDLRVVIIGAGPAGLSLLRHLKPLPNVQVDCYEKGACLGGTWVYTDLVGEDKRGDSIHSSIYKNMRCNFPKQIMSFPDFPFQRHLPSFVNHEQTLNYLERYAKHFDLIDSIQFNTRMEYVEPTQEHGGQWNVSVCDVNEPANVKHRIYDYIVICCGHFSTPNIPSIPGQAEFRGRILHSHDYRVSEEFKGHTLALLGANFSGTDIATDLSSSAKKIYLCHNKNRLTSRLPSVVEERPGIKKLTASTMLLVDDSEEAIDTLMYCTGYRYNLPFLSDSCRLPVVDGRMPTLYKHIFHTEFPSLCIMGACKSCSPFLCYDLQARLIAAAIEGAVSLPSKQEMEDDIKADFLKREQLGLPTRKAHWLSGWQWEYYDDLSLSRGGGHVPLWIKHMFEVNDVHRLADPTTYKDYTFRIVGTDSFEYWFRDDAHERVLVSC